MEDELRNLVHDPHGVLARLREHSALYWSPSWNAWFVTGYAEVAAALKEPTYLVSNVSHFGERLRGSEPALKRVEETLARLLLFLDPPEHTRVRSLVSKTLTPRRVESLSAWLEAQVEDVLERLPPTCDWMEEVARILPARTLAHFFGVPSEDWARLAGWSHHLAGFLGDDELTARKVRLAEQAFQGMRDYFRAQFPSEDELNLILVLFGAGHDTTTNLLGNGLLALLRHPQAATRLRSGETPIERGVEEMLRYDPPSMIASRYASADRGAVRQGQSLNLCLAAANRDPCVFERADDFWPERPEKAHLSFGWGIHYCVGAALARLQARVVFRRFLQRLPHARLAAEPEYYATIAFRRLKTLRVLTTVPTSAEGTQNRLSV